MGLLLTDEAEVPDVSHPIPSSQRVSLPDVLVRKWGDSTPLVHCGHFSAVGRPDRQW